MRRDPPRLGATDAAWPVGLGLPTLRNRLALAHPPGRRDVPGAGDGVSTRITDRGVLRACPEVVVACGACHKLYAPTRWGRETCSQHCSWVLRVRRQRARAALAHYWEGAA